jgi:hypothetical protein
MSAPLPPRPLRASQPRLGVLAGLSVGLLAAVIVAIPLWLGRVPEPKPLRPFERVDSGTDLSTIANEIPTSETALVRPHATRPAVRAVESSGSADEPEAPVVERRWVQRITPAITIGSERLREAAGITAQEGGLNRSAAARRQRVRQFGGTERTEDAVEAGLAWLAAHQDEDGTWDRFEFSRHCPADDPCPGTAVTAKGYSFREGLTGLALLAFLGAGYTDREGPHQEVVARAVEALLRAQMYHGGFGADERMAGYNDALATFALAEYHALTSDPRLSVPLERAVTRLALSQQELGGWDYASRKDSGRNDTSITAWAVQSLHACMAAGVRVPPRMLIKVGLHFERASEPDGRVRYSDTGIGFKIDEKTLEPVYRHGPAMLAAGVTCEQLLGWRPDSGLVRRQQALLFQELPSQSMLEGRDPTQLHSYYYWYYGTIAMFQTGGEHWERWNARLRDAILPLQDRREVAQGRRHHSYGSWPPFGPHWGKWGRQGSRVYTTALCILTLEIYYRHTPAYLEDQPALTAGDWLAYLRETQPRERRRAVQALGEMRVEVAEPVLVELLTDGDRSLALAAAVGLTNLDSPMGRALLEQLRDTTPAWEHEIVAAALRRAREIEALPPVRGTVRIFDAQRGLATLECPRAYIGMVVYAQRDERSLAQLRVIRRFTGQSVVVAEVLGEPPETPLQPGDVVVSR